MLTFIFRPSHLRNICCSLLPRRQQCRKVEEKESHNLPSLPTLLLPLGAHSSYHCLPRDQERETSRESHNLEILRWLPWSRPSVCPETGGGCTHWTESGRGLPEVRQRIDYVTSVLKQKSSGTTTCSSFRWWPVSSPSCGQRSGSMRESPVLSAGSSCQARCTQLYSPAGLIISV